MQRFRNPGFREAGFQTPIWLLVAICPYPFLRLVFFKWVVLRFKRNDYEASLQMLVIINMLYTLAGRQGGRKRICFLRATNQAESVHQRTPERIQESFGSALWHFFISFTLFHFSLEHSAPSKTLTLHVHLC